MRFRSQANPQGGESDHRRAEYCVVSEVLLCACKAGADLDHSALVRALELMGNHEVASVK